MDTNSSINLIHKAELILTSLPRKVNGSLRTNERFRATEDFY